jgi:hypothetical protein
VLLAVLWEDIVAFTFEYCGIALGKDIGIDTEIMRRMGIPESAQTSTTFSPMVSV